MENKKRFRFDMFLVGFTVLVAGLVYFNFSAIVAWAAGITVNIYKVSNNIVPIGGSTILEWDISGATRCIITNNDNSQFYSGLRDDEEITLSSDTTYYLTCTDDMVYYQLYSCYNDNNLLEVGPLPEGTYSTGDKVTGSEFTAIQGEYDYIVTSSNENDNPAKANIQVTMGVGSPSSCDPAPTSATSGTISVMSTSCEIQSGSSSCLGYLGWSVTPAAGDTALMTPNNITVGTGTSGSRTYPVEYGSRTFYLYNSGNLLDDVTITATCASGSWNGTTCNESVILLC